MTLGLEDENILLLLLMLMVSMLTFSGARTNVLHGAVHLLLFFSHLVLILNVTPGWQNATRGPKAIFTRRA